VSGELVVTAIGSVGLVVVAVGLLARFEVLVYAAGWRPERADLPARTATARGAAADRPPAGYLVYLDGIGKMKFRDTRDGGRLVDQLVARAPELRVLGHVLPYSPIARQLTDRKGAAWLRRHAALTLFVYNVLQIFVAADPRYRPTYNRAVGRQIGAQLVHAGYRPRSRGPVVLLSYSGGAQLATGAVRELRVILEPSLTLITLGGFHNGANDLTGICALHQLTSDLDRIERIGRWMFPQRWPAWRRSGWNRARSAGKVVTHRLDPAHHVGPLSYISPEARLPDGRSYLDRTTDEIIAIIRATVTVAPSSSPNTEPPPPRERR
jgi:hypothetical protein